MADSLVGTVIPGGSVAVPGGPVGAFIPMPGDLHVDGTLRIGQLSDDARIYDDGNLHIANATNLWLGRGNPGSNLFVRFNNIDFQTSTATINSGVGNWQFRINAPGTSDCRIAYDLQGVRWWTAGLHYPGRCFMIADESISVARFIIRWEPYQTEVEGRFIVRGADVIGSQLRFPNPDQPWAFHAPGYGHCELWYHDGGGIMSWYMDRVYTHRHIMPLNNDGEWCGVDAWGLSWHAAASHRWHTASDPAEKNDITPMTDSVLDKIIALNPVHFRWNSDPENDKRHHCGFLAPDVRDVMGPDFAGYNANDDPSIAGRFAEGVEGVDNASIKGHQSIDYNELVAVLWRGVQELAAEVKALRDG